ncbi:MAG TPA: energy transducer TonB [Cytophagaceae bacterium]
MNKLILFNLLSIFLLVTVSVSGQEVVQEDKILTWTPEQPVFKGPGRDLNRFIAKNLNYPAEAYSKGIQGQIFIEFVVEKDGSVSNIKIVKGIEELNAESIRVVNLTSGLWIPGKNDGQPVRLRKILPLTFKIQERQTRRR